MFLKRKLFVLTFILAIFLALGASAVDNISVSQGSLQSYIAGDLEIKASDDFVTKQELLVLSGKLHSFINGNPLEDMQDDYSYYVDYAVQNGISTSDNCDAYITRKDAVCVISNVLDGFELDSINEITRIPDVSKDEPYYDDLLTLYNAGIVGGCDEYGSFYPDKYLKYYQLSAVFSRICVEYDRKSFTPTPMDKEAYYLIEDLKMVRTTRSSSYASSGWQYEDVGSNNISNYDYSTNVIGDNYTDNCVILKKQVSTVESGTVTFESGLNIVFGELNIIFKNDSLEDVFLINITDGDFYCIGNEKQTVDYSSDSTNIYMRVVMDLDQKQASVIINNNYCGSYDMAEFTDNISYLYYASTDEGITTATINETYMYVNYPLNETFNGIYDNEKPCGWNASSGAYVFTFNSNTKLKTEVGAEAKYDFEDITDKAVVEAYVYASDASVSETTIYGRDGETFRIVGQNNGFYYNDQLIRSYSDNTWQRITLYFDCKNDTVKIKINGKDCADVSFEIDSLDVIGLSCTDGDYVLFDNVKAYNYYDYADYCPEPVSVNDDEWTIGMSVCSLWREGSHYGWKFVSPYEELTPVLGYYDEGIVEVADWEIKFLAEHGYDFQQFCWYYNPDLVTPRMSYALNDGYLNAKYSDEVSFSLMWENASASVTPEEFCNKIWPYWCDWYFSDDRYASIDNYAVLNIYSLSQFITNMGSVEGAVEIVEFMREDIKNYGYDGLILISAAFVSNYKSVLDNAAALGFDGVMAYHFGDYSYNPEYIMECLTNAYNYGGVPFIPSVGMGYNDIGWTETRTPTASSEDHLMLIEWVRDTYFGMLSEKYKADHFWVDKFVMNNTWNEYGEGHYIIPTSLEGFGYIDANRSVFSTVAGTEDDAHTDVEPTLNQKDRLGYMYIDDIQPMRKLQHYDPLEYIKSNDVVYCWDFEQQEACDGWTVLARVDNLGYDETEKALYGYATSIDSHIRNVDDENYYIDASKARFLHIKMKVADGMSTTGTLYFAY